MDIVFEEFFEELESGHEFDDHFSGGWESEVDFLDAWDDSSLGL